MPDEPVSIARVRTVSPFSTRPRVLPETGFVRLPTVLEHFPIGRSTWWAGVKSGKYPQPVKLGPQTTAWRAEEIRQLIADHASAGMRGEEKAE